MAKPDFDVFAIRDREEGKGKEQGQGKDIYTKIGVAFKRRNSDGVDIVLDALPLGRRLAVVRPLPEGEEK